MAVTDRAHARALDAADPLAPFRARFAIDPDGPLYLDGNSLGRMPLATRDRLQALTGEWAERLVGGWSEWIELPRRAGDALAEGVLGARAGEVLVCDSTTVNLYKLCAAVLDAYRLSAQRAVVTDRGNFPTDRYVLEGLCAQRGLELRPFAADPLLGPRPQDLERALADGSAALIVLSHVAYGSGALADLAGLTEVARRHDAHVVWDLSHSAGAVPVELRAAGAELAVGCSYKYLNAGPGAPAWLYVAEAVQERLRSPIWGWFGQEDQFAMERDYAPARGIDRFAAGTPSILGVAAVHEGARLVAEAGIVALRAKSVALTELAVALYDAWLPPLGFSLGTPREAALRGAHVALRHPDAWPICRALIDRARVVGDFRGPDTIRLGLAPLYTGFAEVWDALDRLRALVAAGDHERVDAAPGRIT
jgi:kynureninase